MLNEKVKALRKELTERKNLVNGINFIAEYIELDSAEAIKDLSFQVKNQIDNLFMLLASEIKGKPSLSLIISDNLVTEKKLNAGIIIREIAKEINGGGGGQPFYATAGGTDSTGISKALEKAKTFLN